MYLMYSKPGCGYCDAARRLLQDNGLEFKEFKLGVDIQRTDLLRILEERNIESRTLPQIFSPDGEYVGGFTELHKKLAV